MSEGPYWQNVGVHHSWTYITSFGQVDLYKGARHVLIVWGKGGKWSSTNGKNVNGTSFFKSQGIHTDVKNAVRALIRMELSHGA